MFNYKTKEQTGMASSTDQVLEILKQKETGTENAEKKENEKDDLADKDEEQKFNKLTGSLKNNNKDDIE